MVSSRRNKIFLQNLELGEKRKFVFFPLAYCNYIYELNQNTDQVDRKTMVSKFFSATKSQKSESVAVHGEYSNIASRKTYKVSHSHPQVRLTSEIA